MIPGAEEVKGQSKKEGESNTEKDKRKLDLLKYDLEFDVDPLFKNMTAKFNETGARGLLLNNLPLDDQLDVLLESKKKSEKSIPIGKIMTQPLKEIIANFESKNCDINNDDAMMRLEICPELDYFKNEKNAENPTKSQNENLIEISLLKNLQTDANMQMDIDNNNNNDKDNQEKNSKESKEEIHSIISDDIQEVVVDNDIVAVNDNDNENEIEIATAPKDKEPQEGILSLIKNEDFIEFNKELMNQIGQGKSSHLLDFTSSYKKLKTIIKKPLGETIVEKKQKGKKEELMIDFLEIEKVEKSEIFKAKKTQAKKSNVKDQEVSSNRKSIVKTRISQGSIFQKDSLVKLFYFPEKFISVNKSSYMNIQNTSPEIEALKCEVKDECNIDNDNDNNNNIPGEEKESPSKRIDLNFDVTSAGKLENMAMIDKDYEKRFGRLYKTFDVRYLKSKIWECLTEAKHESETNTQAKKCIDFESLIKRVYKKVTPEVRNNITHQTCFVCLLHLANEKDINIEMFSGRDTNFLIHL